MTAPTINSRYAQFQIQPACINGAVALRGVESKLTKIRRWAQGVEAAGELGAAWQSAGAEDVSTRVNMESAVVYHGGQLGAGDEEERSGQQGQAGGGPALLRHAQKEARSRSSA
jgi:hypothetical protein